jgi:hypothetical protein
MIPRDPTLRLIVTKSDEDQNGIKLSPNVWCINMLWVSRQELRELVRAVDGGMTASD